MHAFLSFNNPLIMVRRSVLIHLHLGNYSEAAMFMVEFSHTHNDPHSRLPAIPNGFSTETW